MKNRSFENSNFVRIDRRTKWGNPFIIDRDGTRQQVLDKYCAWFLFNKELQKEAKLLLKDKVLGCWCKPEACHGDILAEFVDNAD